MLHTRSQGGRATAWRRRSLATATAMLAGVVVAASLGAPAHAAVTRQSIVDVARGEVGTAGNSSLCQKYGPCANWCAMFATWVWQTAGISGVPRSTYTGRGLGQWGVDNNLFKARGSGNSPAQIGDWVIYGSPAYATGGHVAIVSRVNSNGTLDTIDGNYNNKVVEHTINPQTATAGDGDYKISGYVSPPGAVDSLINGNVDSVTSLGAGVVRFAGWAFDPAASSTSIQVHVYEGDVLTPSAGRAVFEANQSRPDVNNAYGINGNHGFDGTLTGVPAGSHVYCLYGVHGNTNARISCNRVDVAAIKGNIDELTSTGGGVVHARGWAFDPTTSGESIQVHVYEGDVLTPSAGRAVFEANQSRSDVNNAYGINGNHGFDGTLTGVAPGSHVYCFWGVHDGLNTQLSCNRVDVAAPKGNLDSATALGNGTVQFKGWTFDPDAASESIEAHVYEGQDLVASAGRTVLQANQSRPDVNNAYGITGNHGFDGTLTGITPGSHEYCLYGVHDGINAKFGCTTLTVS